VSALNNLVAIADVSTDTLVSGVRAAAARAALTRVVGVASPGNPNRISTCLGRLDRNLLKGKLVGCADASGRSFYSTSGMCQEQGASAILKEDSSA
jgi:hypothetical protein